MTVSILISLETYKQSFYLSREGNEKINCQYFTSQ